MARVVSIGAQGFENLRTNDYFYVDKTSFISDWWHSGDTVTLICRPRRFGKTLMLDTVRCFLSTDYAGRGEALFGGLDVCADDSMRVLQGTVPVIALSFARCKGATLQESLASMRQVIRVAVREHDYLLSSDKINGDERALLARVSDDMDVVTATTSLGQLCSMLHKHWGVRPVVLLDEYDTPLQEAWLSGYWDGMASFVRQLFNATFKTNPSLGRALVTGITRVASESILLDMDNPAVVTITTPQYEQAFGFTEGEVEAALVEFGLHESMALVREWYDGFTFGESRDIYNPWSITHFLKYQRLGSYWANSSSNALVSELVQTGDTDLKGGFEGLLVGEPLTRRVDERVHFRRLRTDSDAVWGLLLATGYLKVVGHDDLWENLDLALTDLEVSKAFDGMVREWFAPERRSYNAFVRALLACDTLAMGRHLSSVADACMSSFDSGTHPGASQPERFWHGLVLGLIVDLRGRYEVRSNLESGYGRCDVLLVPLKDELDPAFVLEFKVVDPEAGERSLEDAMTAAHVQIEQKAYAASLVERGVALERIHELGIVFEGKRVLVG